VSLDRIDFFGINFTNTQRTPTSPTDTGITDVKLIQPGYPANTTQLFTNQFLQALQPFGTLRYLGVDGANYYPNQAFNSQTLATVQVSSGTLRVTISNNTDNAIGADAISVTPVSGTGAPMIIDDSQFGFSTTGSDWQSWPTGYDGEHLFAPSAPGGQSGPATDTATWQFTGLAPGTYLVQSLGDPSIWEAGNVPYQIYDGSTLVQSLIANQATNPAGSSTPLYQLNWSDRRLPTDSSQDDYRSCPQ
jgi:hypothetical protein